VCEPIAICEQLLAHVRTHGLPQIFFQGEQCRNFAYPFQVADDAEQIDVHKPLYPFSTTKKRLHVRMIRKQSQKWRRFVGAAMIVFHSYFFLHMNKTTWLTPTSSHCLAALPAKMSAAFNSHMRQNDYYVYLK